MKSSPTLINAVIDVTADFINKDATLREKYSTGNSINNFKVDDIVKCTYIKILFRVNGFDRDKLELISLDSSLSPIRVSPEFVIKVDCNKSAIKVLYG